jgi:VanZ family protein
VILWLPVVLCMALMYWGATTPVVPGIPDFLTDTLLHAGAYTVLALLTLRATTGGRWTGVTRKAMLLAFVIAMLHGLSVEWIQIYIPTRVAEWRDVANDLLGTVAGLGAAWAWGIMRRQSHDL